MERDELAAWLRLALTPGVGNITARKLLAAFGLPQAVFGQSVAALCQVATAAQAAELLRLPAELESQTERTWRWLHEASDGIGRHVATLGDDAYPASLLDIEDPPLLLYLTGRLPSATRKPAIAIVGSRNPTPQGKTHAHRFAQHFTQTGFTVVSGLALLSLIHISEPTRPY